MSAIDPAALREQAALARAATARLDETPPGSDERSVATYKLAALAIDFAVAIPRLLDALEESKYVAEVRHHRCECAEDEACAFARERDVALAKVEVMRGALAPFAARLDEVRASVNGEREVDIGGVPHAAWVAASHAIGASS